MNLEKAHKYEYVVNRAAQTAPVFVIHMVGESKRVLEIGCGPGSITKVLAQQNQCRVTGLELDPEAIKKAAPYCETIIQADLNSMEWPLLLDGLGKFDVVVAADVLEHLYNPCTTLEYMTSFINSSGYLIISLPHVGHAGVVSCLINSNFDYRDWGLLDRTHIRFFGLKNIEVMLAQASLKIIEAKYVVKLPQDTEFEAEWSKLSSSMQDALMNCPYSEVYQVVVKAVPFNYPGDPVSLVPPQHIFKRPFNTNLISWKIRVGRYLSPQLKRHIRKGFKLLGVNL